MFKSVSVFLLLLSFTLQGFAQSASITLTSLDFTVTPAGGVASTTNYTTGAGTGTPLAGASLGTFALTDVISIDDIYGFTSQATGCDVSGATLEFTVSPTSFPFLSQTQSAPLVLQAECGATWRTGAANCAVGDKEFGASSVTYDLAPLAPVAALGPFTMNITYTLTTAGCTPAITTLTASTSFNIGAAPLPVDLTRFSVERKGGFDKLRWEAAQELNFEKYAIEQSVDGETFTTLDYLMASGKELQPAQYGFSVLASAKTSYYRLKMIDLDGTFSYSDIVVASSADVTEGLQVSPNPVATGAAIQLGEVSESATIRLVNASGKIVATWAGSAGVSLDLPSIPAGLYTLSVQDGTMSTSQRLLVID
ncbi:MAG: T9SS type A sorting domain-containing protein [Saprospiraceae bacterium]